MIEKEFKNAYKSICANEDLRKKIEMLEFQSPKRQAKHIIKFTAMAACLVLVMAAFVF